MESYRFMELVEKEKGFEYYQAFRDEVDWIIGGKDGTYWFSVLKDQSVKETYIGTFKDGVWADRKVKGKGKKRVLISGLFTVRNQNLCYHPTWKPPVTEGHLVFNYH